MYKAISAAAALLFSGSLLAQDAAPPPPTPVTDPAILGVSPPAQDTMPGVTGRGEAVSNDEFNHRQRLRKLERTLEIEEAEVKISEAQSRRRKADGNDDGAAIQMPLPVMNRSTAYIPSRTSGLQSTAMALQPDAAVPPPAAPEPAPVIAAPEVIGLIGDRALFKVDDMAVSASTGDDVGDYTVVAISGRRVTLASKTSKGTKKVLTAP